MDKISEKDKKNWEDFLSNDEKLPNKDAFEIEKKGFKASISLDAGIDEMLEIFKLRDTKIINNY